MRILVVTNLFPPTFLGGYELGCGQAVAELRRRGHELRVLTSSKVPPSEGVAPLMPLEPVYVSELKRSVSRDVAWAMHGRACLVSASSVGDLLREIEDFRPDVAYLWNLVGVGGVGLVAALDMMGVPWVWHLMDAVPAHLCSGPDGVVAPLAEAFASVTTGPAIACSRALAGEIAAEGIEMRGDIHIIPNWVVPSAASAPPRPRMEGGRLRLVTAGALGQHKGLHIATEAIARLRGRGFGNVTLDAYGPIVEDFAERMIHAHGVREQVRLMGSRTQAELDALYPDYDVFVFPTWEREPFGFAPLEAAAAGCVPLMTSRCGISEWLVDGVHCLKADRDADAFAAQLARILEGTIDIDGLARRASATVRRDFAIDAVFDRVDPILTDAARTRRAARAAPGRIRNLAEFAQAFQHVALADAARLEHLPTP